MWSSIGREAFAGSVGDRLADLKNVPYNLIDPPVFSKTRLTRTNVRYHDGSRHQNQAAATSQLHSAHRLLLGSLNTWFSGFAVLR
ncbi:MAG: hypothetical protein JWP25_2058 [Bradyrhizobium sp.]|nr:hypothetical protein [Bradyrhizobium sp.]